jgi:hypothetical protein
MHTLHCASSAGQVISANRVCMATLPRLIRIHCVTLHVSSGVRFIHVAWHACCAYSAWPVAHGAAPVDPMQPPYARAAPHAHFFMRCDQCFTSRAARPVAHMHLRDHHARAVRWSHSLLILHGCTRAVPYTHQMLRRTGRTGTDGRVMTVTLQRLGSRVASLRDTNCLG